MSSPAGHCLESNRRMCSFASGTWANLPRAVRPLAASAPTAAFEALEGSGLSSVCAPLGKMTSGQGSGSQGSSSQGSLASGRIRVRLASRGHETCARVGRSLPTVASRRSARQSRVGRAGTSCFAARAGGFGLLVSGATQRKMQGRVVPRVRPNPSIERTCPGKPGHASHLKR